MWTRFLAIWLVQRYIYTDQVTVLVNNNPHPCKKGAMLMKGNFYQMFRYDAWQWVEEAPTLGSYSII